MRSGSLLSMAYLVGRRRSSQPIRKTTPASVPFAPWRLVDVERDKAIVIESFYPDEELDAVHGVANLYLADQHIKSTAAR